MVRRTLALTGVAALALGVTGLAGPAAADVGTIQTDADVMVNEVAVAHGTVDTAVELFNDTTSPISLEGWTLRGCTDVSSSPFTLATFGSFDNIPADDFLVAPLGLSGLEQADGAAYLEDATSTFVHGVRWGTPHSSCVGSLDLEPAGVVPDNDNSIQRESATIWCAGAHTMANTNINCP